MRYSTTKILFILTVCLLLVIGIQANAYANTYSFSRIDNTVDVGEDNTDIAIDSEGSLGTCYQDTTNNLLKYAFYNGDDWTLETADDDGGSGDNVGEYCAIIFDGDDQPHIAYFNTTDSQVRHAVKIGDNWIVRVVDNNVGTDFMTFGGNRISMAKDGTGLIGIAYYEAGADDLIYAEWDGVEWDVVTLENAGTVGRYPSLAYDSNDNAGIAYQLYINENTASLMYKRHDGNAWLNAEVVDNRNRSGAYAALAFDVNDVPHIAYRHINAGNLQYLYYTNKVSGSWQGKELANGGAAGVSAGQYNDMVIGEEGNAHIITRQYAFSALFGSVYYMKMYNLYFVDELPMNKLFALSHNITFSAAPKRHYYGMSVAMDDQGALAYSGAVENSGDNDNSLYAGWITDWEPQVRILTPDAESNTAVDDLFVFRWETFDPDGDARVRFNYRVDFNDTQINASVNAAPGNVNMNLINVPSGSFQINAQISDDGFQMYQTSMAPNELVIPVREGEEEEQDEEQEDDQDDVQEEDDQVQEDEEEQVQDNAQQDEAEGEDNEAEADSDDAAEEEDAESDSSDEASAESDAGDNLEGALAEALASCSLSQAKVATAAQVNQMLVLLGAILSLVGFRMLMKKRL
jgi:hypothetical protein